MISKELEEEIIRIRRDIHAHPEIEFDVERTASIAEENMRGLGYEVRTGIGRTGVMADLNVPGASKRILLRADMDALPMDEENELPFKSTVPGRAHMCGHDAHTAMLIGAAHVLAAHKDELKCNVRLVFQPSEEKPPGGAREMIADGAAEGVDQAYALHVWPWLPVGEIALSRGYCMACTDGFEIEIRGKGGHAAMPHMCIDPIVAGSHIVTALQTLVSRNLGPIESGVVSVTIFQAGTTAYNVIPQTCRIAGTVRSYRPEDQELLQRRLTEIVELTAAAHGTTATVDYQIGYPAVINHDEACDHVVGCAGDLRVHDKFPKALGGEDFAYFSLKAPSAFVRLGSSNSEWDQAYGVHHPRFQIDESCLKMGAELLAKLALNAR